MNVNDEGFIRVSRKNSIKIPKPVPIVPTLIDNAYGVLSSKQTDNNTASASSLVVASKVEKIRLIIVRAEDQSTKTFVDRIRAVLRQNDLNINFNSKD